MITRPGQLGKYIALSYCWGQTPFFVLNTANKAELEQCIPLEKLSQTIRDTIEVAKQLDVRFVWIDSLCIIQGQEDEAIEDWENEAQHMGSIFRRAFITVAASGSTDAHQGLFCDRNELRSYHECPIGVGDGGIVYLGHGGSERRDHPPIEPLNGRGWAYQEAFLSIRTLAYESKELSWTCRAARCREGLVDSTHIPPSAAERDQSRNIRENWRSMVEDYTSRSLTFPSDKLPAISGLAQLAEENSPDTYVYGVWRDQLVRSLLWQHLGQTLSGKRVYSRQAKQWAPSWSWASVDGKVKFLKGANPVAVEIESVEDKGLLMRGKLQKVKTMRSEASASYYGGYDNYLPWACFPTTMKTYLDSVEEIPPQFQSKKTLDDPQALFDVWFLYLGEDCGLIVCELQDMEPSPWGLLRSACQALLTRRRFVRLGLFTGHPVPAGFFEYKAQTTRLLLL